MAFHHRLFCTLNCNSCSKFWQATIYLYAIHLAWSLGPDVQPKKLSIRCKEMIVCVRVIQKASHTEWSQTPQNKIGVWAGPESGRDQCQRVTSRVWAISSTPPCWGSSDARMLNMRNRGRKKQETRLHTNDLSWSQIERSLQKLHQPMADKRKEMARHCLG